MAKQVKGNKYITLSGLFLFLALVSAAVALCIWRYLPSQPLGYYVPAAASVAIFLAYIIVCCVASVKCEDGKSYFLLAWAIVLVSCILVAFSPIAGIMWVFENLAEKLRKKEQF